MVVYDTVDFFVFFGNRFSQNLEELYPVFLVSALSEHVNKFIFDAGTKSTINSDRFAS